MKPRTPEHCQAISKALKNKPKSEEHKARIAQAMTGKRKSKEHRTAISVGLYLHHLEKEAERDQAHK